MIEQQFRRRDYDLRRIVDDVMAMTTADNADKAAALIDAGVPMARVASLMMWSK